MYRVLTVETIFLAITRGEMSFSMASSAYLTMLSYCQPRSSREPTPAWTTPSENITSMSSTWAWKEEV